MDKSIAVFFVLHYADVKKKVQGYLVAKRSDLRDRKKMESTHKQTYLSVAVSAVESSLALGINIHGAGRKNQFTLLIWKPFTVVVGSDKLGKQTRGYCKKKCGNGNVFC